MSGPQCFVVSDPKGTTVQRYKWLWEEQRAEFILLRTQYETVLQALKEERIDNVASHKQLEFALRERDLYAASLGQAHKVVARYEALVVAMSAPSQNSMNPRTLQ